MKYRHVAAAFYNTPFALLPEKLAEIQALVERKAFGPPAAWDDGREFVAAPPRRNVTMAGRVAMVQVFGTLTQRANLFSEASGGTSTEQLGAALDQLGADRGVRSVVLVVDSPGGSVFGVPELAAKVQALRAQKKVVAVADSLMASAAYWVGAQASEVYSTPGGQVGSVGVIAAHVDQSKLEELAGVKTTLVTAGKFKAELDPSLPLTAEARDALQQAVDQYYGMFVADVARGRGVPAARVRSDYGQGRMLTAQDAKAAGLIDGVKTLEAVLRGLGADPGAGPAAAAATLPGRVAALRARAVELDG